MTLGYNEKNDLKSFVEYLRNKDYISEYFYAFLRIRFLPYPNSIGLWGRSMGAVTSILFAAKDHNIACMCLDSAFSNLSQLCIETLKSRVIPSSKESLLISLDFGIIFWWNVHGFSPKNNQEKNRFRT